MTTELRLLRQTVTIPARAGELTPAEKSEGTQNSAQAKYGLASITGNRTI